MKAEYTVDDVLGWDPCPDYTREYVTKLFAGRQTVTVFDVAEMDIPKIDIGWALGHMMPWPDDFSLPEGVDELRVVGNPDLAELAVPEGAWMRYLHVKNNPKLKWEGS